MHSAVLCFYFLISWTKNAEFALIIKKQSKERFVETRNHQGLPSGSIKCSKLEIIRAYLVGPLHVVN